MIEPNVIIEHARAWLGVPFLHQGRSRSGVDCVGLVIQVGKECGLLPQSFEKRDYGRLPVSGQLLDGIKEYCIQGTIALPGTLVVIKYGKEPHHLTICTGATLIHASATPGLERVVEHGYRHPWPKLTQSIWRLPGVNYE